MIPTIDFKFAQFSPDRTSKSVASIHKVVLDFVQDACLTEVEWNREVVDIEFERLVVTLVLPRLGSTPGR